MSIFHKYNNMLTLIAMLVGDPGGLILPLCGDPRVIEVLHGGERTDASSARPI